MLFVFENFWKENVYLSDKLKWKNEEERWVIRNIFVQGDWRGVGSPFMMQKLASNIKTYNHKSLYVKASQARKMAGFLGPFYPAIYFHVHIHKVLWPKWITHMLKSSIFPWFYRKTILVFSDTFKISKAILDMVILFSKTYQSAL